MVRDKIGERIILKKDGYTDLVLRPYNGGYQMRTYVDNYGDEKWKLLPMTNDVIEPQIIENLLSQLTYMTSYADKLAAGLPEGMLPKDVEIIRDANWKFAQENFELKQKLGIDQ